MHDVLKVKMKLLAYTTALIEAGRMFLQPKLQRQTVLLQYYELIERVDSFFFTVIKEYRTFRQLKLRFLKMLPH